MFSQLVVPFIYSIQPINRLTVKTGVARDVAVAYATSNARVKDNNNQQTK